MATGGSLAAAALQAALNVSPPEGIDGPDMAAAVAHINRLLASYSAQGFLPPTGVIETLTLAAGQASYTVGTGGQMNTARPDVVQNAVLRDGAQDFPLALADRDGWLRIALKSTPGQPDRVYYDPTYPFGTLSLYPVPQKTYTLVLDSLKPLPQFAGVTTVMNLPGEYEEPLIYNAALRLCAAYGFPASQEVVALAQQGDRLLRRKNARSPAPPVDPALARPGRFDINSGTYR